MKKAFIEAVKDVVENEIFNIPAGISDIRVKTCIISHGSDWKKGKLTPGKVYGTAIGIYTTFDETVCPIEKEFELLMSTIVEYFNYEHVVQDRHGYWSIVVASSGEEAIRLSSNLSSEASLEYATTKYVGKNIPYKNVERNNCKIAMGFGVEECYLQ